MRTSARLDNLAIERSWLHRGASLIAGTDEVGRGAWAGPVVAGMVATHSNLILTLPADLHGINDSKLLSPQQRAALVPHILNHVDGWGVGAATSREIAEDGFGSAIRLAIRRAYDALSSQLWRAPDVLLTDAVNLPDSPIPSESHPKADRRCLTVAMASILAKVHRDRLMQRFDPIYPCYDFANNKGYGTRKHQQALSSIGPCAIHRMSFQPVMRAASELFPASHSTRVSPSDLAPDRNHAVPSRGPAVAMAECIEDEATLRSSAEL